MLPSKARMLMIDVCSWLSTSISWKDQLSQNQICCVPESCKNIVNPICFQGAKFSSIFKVGLKNFIISIPVLKYFLNFFKFFFLHYFTLNSFKHKISLTNKIIQIYKYINKILYMKKLYIFKLIYTLFNNK